MSYTHPRVARLEHARRGSSTGTITRAFVATVMALISVIPAFTPAAADRAAFALSHRSRAADTFNSVSGLSVVQPGLEVSIQAGVAQGGRQLASSQRSSRSLLNQSHSHSQSPKCPKCWFYMYYQGSYFGHCRSNGRLYNCYKRNTFARMAAGPPDGQARTDDLAATAPFVTCFQDSDCALPAANFPPVTGDTAVSVDGTLSATCRRPSFVNDPSGTFADFPGICICAYVTPAAPPAVMELLSAGDTASLPDLDSLTLDGTPFSSFFTTDFCVQLQGRGPDGDVDDRPFFVPGPEPIDENEDPSLPGPPEETVSDPSLYVIGVVAEEAYVLIDDTTAAIVNPGGDDDPGDDNPPGCTGGGECAENNHPCAGSPVGLLFALPCCSDDFRCVRGSGMIAICIKGDVAASVASTVEGSVLPCGTPYDAVVP